VVHFAGTTHGDVELLCREPLRYPVLLPAALPLYLSVLGSYHKECPVTSYPVSGVCRSAVAVVLRMLQADSDGRATAVRYNPGRGRFTWPPKL
jgi:hypothetical protein